MSDLDDPATLPIAITILCISTVCSIIVCILTVIAAHFVKTRAINRIAYLNRLVMLAEKRLCLQVFPERALSKVANMIGGNIREVKEDRTAFSESKNNTTKKTDFKVPENAYDEASFNDEKYKTTYSHAAMSNDDMFLHKKPIIVPVMSEKNQ